MADDLEKKKKKREKAARGMRESSKFGMTRKSLRPYLAYRTGVHKRTPEKGLSFLRAALL